MKRSRWGSFLQQAVAGVEAHLDTILTDDDDGIEASAKSQDTNVAAAEAPTVPSPGKLCSFTASDQLVLMVSLIMD